MGRGSEITRDWADGTYHFCLKLKEIRQLQEACDAGPATIWQRLYQGDWLINDVVETIRLGLIGGGMEPVAAMKLVNEYYTPVAPNIPVALDILHAVVEGPADEPLPKAEAAAEEEVSPISQEENSASPPSTDGASSSAEVRPMSMDYRCGKWCLRSTAISR